jgi:DNA (cytosine-5)-methyltransferase 1
MTLKVATDFSGIGSPEAALRRLKIPHDNVFACDIDKYAKASYLELNNPKKFYDNITTRNHKEVEPLDLYVAGFPCQAFSYAGKRKGFADETRGTLFFDVAEFIRANQPNCFILENVRGLVSHDKGKTFQTIIDILSNGGGTINGQMGLDSIEDGLGYHIYYQILNSKDYGIPQNRERIFIVGFKHWRSFNFPKEMPLTKTLKDVLQNGVDEKYYLSQKMIDGFSKHKERHQEKGTGFQWKPKTGNDIANCVRANGALCPTDNTIIETNNKRVNNNFKKHKDEIEEGDFMDSYNQSIHKDVAPTITSRITGSNNYHIFQKKEDIIIHNLHPRCGDPKKGGTGHLSKTDGIAYCLDAANSIAVEIPKIIGYTRDKDSVVVDRHLKDEANTLHSSTGSGGNTDQFVLSRNIRRLTPLETWRLQGFDDDDFYKAEKVCSNTQLYKQAGNSITVDVMVEIFKKIYLK